MAALVFLAGEKYPDNTAYEYLRHRRSFRELEAEVRQCAKSFRALGIAPGDRVTLSLPNVPQALVMFYALNLLGAVACMTHPLSSGEEMEFYLASAKSRAFVTLYQFYDKFRPALESCGTEHIILTGAGDALPPPLRAALSLREKKPPRAKNVLRYGDFLRLARNFAGGYEHPARGDDVAAVLYSGGTSGRTKGILLTNLNFNACALLTGEAGDCVVPGTKMLAVMPIFHGFGLGVCIHTALVGGLSCLLVPRFTVKSYAKLLKNRRPNYIAGVPTLYEALLRLPDTGKLDLSPLLGVFSGGDSLPPELKNRVDRFLSERGATVRVREGYGLTECVTACCLTPPDGHREGSIGLPFRDTLFKIVTPETHEELPPGQTGEICICGPTVMAAYDGDAAETRSALQTHSDGRVWLHTGDLGELDADGYVYFRGRLKRMIVSSGYSVYPFQVESVLNKHEYVKQSCVVGVPDDYRMERVKAFLILGENAPPEGEAIEEIRAYCKLALAPYNRPREFEVRESFPVTLVGKIAYTKL
jgi:long-chain acyl-CoA synthetase